MSSTALLLVLAAAVAHAAWNVIAHGSSRSGTPFLWWAAVASATLWIGVVPLTGGIGTDDLAGLVLGITVSAALHCGYMLVLQRGYSVGELSTVYATARGSGPLITVIVAVLVLHERPGIIALVGVGVVIVGVIAIGLVDRGRTSRGIDRSIFYGLITGVAIAAYTLWDANALRTWGIAPVAFMVGCSLLEIPIYTVTTWRRRRELLPTLRTQWTRIVAFGVLSPLSYILVLTATTIAPVALVAPLREVSVVLVSIFGALVLREGRPALRIAAASIVVAGVGLLAI